MHNSSVYKLLKKIWYKVILSFYGEKGVPYRVNDFKFRMPRSSYRYVEARFFPKDYERENFKFFQQMASKDMVCIDIGAHIGLYAVFMSTRGNARDGQPQGRVLKAPRRSPRTRRPAPAAAAPAACTPRPRPPARWHWRGPATASAGRQATAWQGVPGR